MHCARQLRQPRDPSRGGQGAVTGRRTFPRVTAFTDRNDVDGEDGEDIPTA
jgi:hypothetical protein